MSAKRKPILLVSSAVYGFEELLDRIYAELVGFNYEVWMSHKGTVPVYPDMTALDSCRRAVQECDLFLGIILPRYGSGVEEKGGDSITHEELRWAIHLNKPRWILAHDHVVFARSFLDKLGFDTQEKRHTLKLHPSAVFQDLRAIDMYDLASRHDVKPYRDKTGNWVQKFSSPEEAQLFAVSQFRRFQEAEAFIQDKFEKPEAVKRAVDEKGGAA